MSVDNVDNVDMKSCLNCIKNSESRKNIVFTGKSRSESISVEKEKRQKKSTCFYTQNCV